MSDATIRYFTFPLVMVREIITEGKKEGISSIMDYCFYYKAQEEKRDALNCIYRALEDYIEDGQNVTSQLTSCIHDAWQFYLSKYSMENVEDFQCTPKNINYYKIAFGQLIRDSLPASAISRKCDAIITHGRIAYSKSFFKMAGGSNVMIWENGEKMQNKYHSKAPIVSIGVDAFLGFLKEGHTDDFVLMYLAIRSRIGIRSELCCTVSDAIKMRMIGAHNEAELTLAKKVKTVKAFFDKISKRYQFDKCLNLLIKNNYVLKLGWKFGHKSRLYLTCSLTAEQFPFAIKAHMDKMNSRKRDHEIKQVENSLKNSVLNLISTP